jgi:hypothetical protein
VIKILTFATTLCAVALMAGSANANVISGVYSTGVDTFGAQIAYGQSEEHYTLVSSPDGAVTSIVAADASTQALLGVWLANDSKSGWIGPDDTIYYGPIGAYDYKMTFTLAAGLNPDTVSIGGEWAADNIGTDILVNGASTGETTPNFSGFVTFDLTSGFVSGTNTIDFLVTNLDPSPTGLRVEIDSATASETTAVPEPATGTFLLGSGLLALRSLRRRRA